MINQQQIKIALNTLPKNKPFDLSEIQDFIQSYFQLDNEDWKSTKSIKNYPRWKHRLQAALHNFKKKGFVEHEPMVAAKNTKDGTKKEPRYKFK